MLILCIISPSPAVYRAFSRIPQSVSVSYTRDHGSLAVGFDDAGLVDPYGENNQFHRTNRIRSD